MTERLHIHFLRGSEDRSLPTCRAGRGEAGVLCRVLVSLDPGESCGSVSGKTRLALPPLEGGGARGGRNP